MKNRGIAHQLFEIAQLESPAKIGMARALIVGDGEIAAELKALINETGASAVLLDEAAGKGEFSLVFLLEPTDNERLLPLIAENALLIDCAAKSNGEWAIFDGNNSYHRVRVASFNKI